MRPPLSEIEPETLGVSAGAALAFDRAHAGAMQFVEMRPWIPSIGVTYHLGADGLSFPLVMFEPLMIRTPRLRRL